MTSYSALNNILHICWSLWTKSMRPLKGGLLICCSGISIYLYVIPYHLFFFYCRLANETFIPSLGLVISSAHGRTSSKVCVDSRLKLRKTWAKTSFSSRRANRWPWKNKWKKGNELLRSSLMIITRRSFREYVLALKLRWCHGQRSSFALVTISSPAISRAFLLITSKADNLPVERC